MTPFRRIAALLFPARSARRAAAHRAAIANLTSVTTCPRCLLALGRNGTLPPADLPDHDETCWFTGKGRTP